MNLQDAYRGKKVLVTGGLGFVGSNLALRLLELGAEVHVVDAMLPDCGGNHFNLQPACGRVRVSIEDLRNLEFMKTAVAGCDVIFNLAGQISHLGSMQHPQNDLEINCRAQLSLLEACRHANPQVKVVFASSRQLYGRPVKLPVDENHPVEPVDINGIHKRAAERYHFIYSVYGLRAAALRMTNTYGPRQLVRHNLQGFIGWFIRKALDGEEITLFGDGSQLRDPVYVDDAVTAFLQAGDCPAADGELFNLGCEPRSLRQIAETLIAICGSGRIRIAPFPEDRKPIDIGSYYADYGKARRLLGWNPEVKLEEGLRRAVAYFREHKERYW
jgi:UDP-glucose 4-epimerase